MYSETILAHLLACTLLITAACLGAVPSTEPAPQVSPIASGVTLSLTPENPSARAGEPVRVTATVMNQSNATVFLTHRDDDLLLGMSVAREDGLPVRKSSLVEAGTGESIHTNNRRRIALPPDRQITYRVTLTACFDMTRPGIYVIRASNRAYAAGIEGGFPLQSELKVRVAPPEDGYGSTEPIRDSGGEGQPGRR